MFWYKVQYFYMKYRRKWQKMDISQVKYRNIVLTCITSVYFISYSPPMALMDIITFFCMDFFPRIYVIHMEIQTSIHHWLWYVVAELKEAPEYRGDCDKCRLVIRLKWACMEDTMKVAGNLLCVCDCHVKCQFVTWLRASQAEGHGAAERNGSGSKKPIRHCGIW